MKRRNFIQALGAGAAASSLVPSALAGASQQGRFRMGKGGVIKKLVVCFLRGGNDGLNTLIPVESQQYNYYQALRPTVGLLQVNLFNLNNTPSFAAHPGLAPLVPLINSGQVSLMHAVGYPSPDRSHFESQAYYETGVPGNGLLSGWLNRYLTNTAGPGTIRAINVGDNISQSVAGSVPVPTSTNFGNSQLEVDHELGGADADEFRNDVAAIYNLPPTPGNEALYGTGDRIFDMINSFSTRNLNDYTPENGAAYPNSGFGRRCMHAAQMLKDDDSFLGVEVVTVNQGGYDTHANQVPSANSASVTTGHGRLLRELAECMSAFYTDMGPVRMADCAFLVVSEFGRRAFQNDSFGTDHGIGGVSMVMGGGANGSVLNDGPDWPGLAQGDQDRGNLAWVTDFRDIYWEILNRHMGVDNATLANIIPGHTYSALNIMS